jgi:hypothetical protein
MTAIIDVVHRRHYNHQLISIARVGNVKLEGGYGVEVGKEEESRRS